MERRLLKDFQIGLVEGLIQDAITSNEKTPKDVFSKIAKAIGRRTSQGSKKKDWNAMVRQKSVARDPIGSTAEGTERRHRQSVRRYILDHQKDSIMSMDANKLVEYNPLLAEIAPMARVAYAKFKIPKIKQEYEENTAGADEVFENAPTVGVVDETKKSSIARPRPRSTRQVLMAGALPYPKVSTSTDADKQKTDDDQAAKPKQLQKSATLDVKDGEKSSVTDVTKTPEPVKKEQEQPKPEPKKPKSEQDQPKSEPGGSQGAAKDVDKPSSSSSEEKSSELEGKGEESENKDEDKKKDEDKNKDAEKDKDKDGKHLKPESPKRMASPKKQGGKSKVTGEILTGWLWDDQAAIFVLVGLNEKITIQRHYEYIIYIIIIKW